MDLAQGDRSLVIMEHNLDAALARADMDTTAVIDTWVSDGWLGDDWSSFGTFSEPGSSQNFFEKMFIADLENIDPDELSDAVGDMAGLMNPVAQRGWPDVDSLLDDLSAEEALNLKNELIPVDSDLKRQESEEQAG